MLLDKAHSGWARHRRHRTAERANRRILMAGLLWGLSRGIVALVWNRFKSGRISHGGTDEMAKRALAGDRPGSSRSDASPGAGRAVAAAVSQTRNDAAPRKRRRRRLERLVAEAEVPAAHAPVRSGRHVVRRRRSHHHTGDAPGRLVNTKAWVFQTNRANVTHVEEGASDPPMRAVLIEVKTPAPRAAAAEPADGLRQVAGAPAWENNRAAAWLVTGGTSAPKHRHVGDAVEMVFDASTHTEGDVRPGRNGSHGPDAGRRRRGRTSSRSSREAS